MEIFTDLLETVPGLTLVFTISALFLIDKDSEIAQGIRAFVVAWALYRTSSGLDRFFDLAYGPGPRPGTTGEKKSLLRLRQHWCSLRTILVPGFSGLEKRRNDALRVLRRTQDGTKGLYKIAKTRVVGEQWDE